MHIKIREEKPTSGDFIAIHKNRTIFEPKTRKTCLGYLPIKETNSWAGIYSSVFNTRGWIPVNPSLAGILHFQGKKYRMEFNKSDLSFSLDNDLFTVKATIQPTVFCGAGHNVYYNAVIELKGSEN